MKITIKNLIFATIMIITALFSFNADAQNPKIQLDKNALRQKREVQNFVDSFMSILVKEKDLSKIPNSFFVDDFKRRFSDANDYKINEGLSKTLYTETRFKLSNLSFNFTYLGIVYLMGKFSSREFEKAETAYNKDNKNKDKDPDEMFFSPEIFRLTKQKTLMSKLNDSDFEIKTVREFN